MRVSIDDYGKCRRELLCRTVFRMLYDQRVSPALKGLLASAELSCSEVRERFCRVKRSQVAQSTFLHLITR